VAGEPGARAGALTVRRQPDGALEVRFEPAGTFRGGAAHAAWLAFDQGSNPTAGENRGRAFKHDFVALDEKSAALTQDGASFKAHLPGPGALPGKTGLAVWISAGRDPAPVQAGGAYLP
jgi:hypothetical protein